jgi:hypothetical protein
MIAFLRADFLILSQIGFVFIVYLLKDYKKSSIRARQLIEFCMGTVTLGLSR